MEEERSTVPQSHQGGEAAVEQVEVTDRGLFGFGKKKAAEEEDKKQEEGLVSGMEKVSVEEQPEAKEEEETHEEGHKHETLFTKLQRSSSSSSSSSDEEEEEEEVIDDNGEVLKRKKKKGLKEKIAEKLPGHKDTEGEHVTGLPAPAPPASMQTHHEHDTAVPVEKIDADVKTDSPAAAVPEEEKKGFMEKIKEKLPGGHKKPEDAAAVPVTHSAPEPVYTPAPAPTAEEVSSPDAKEKKGLLGKIMDKLSHKPAGEEDKAAGEHKTSA